MVKKLLSILFITILTSPIATAQITSVGPVVPSTFKSDFLRKQKQSKHQKSTSCASDTLRYSRYNATFDRFIQIVNTGTSPISGVGMFFEVEDTVVIRGVRFYARANANGSSATVNVYYAGTNQLPAGLPLVSTSHTLNTGFNILSFMLQNASFSQPLTITADFVITVEVASGVTAVFASNSWLDNDGLGKDYSSIRASGGWTNNVTVGSDPFDADFYLEPVVDYNLKARFKPGPTSCLGNGLPFDFVNTTWPATNPFYSPEAIDQTLDDNFIWDYGDGSNPDTVLDGSHSYAAVIPYFVGLEADFKTWSGSCQDVTSSLIDVSTLSANFNTTRNNLTVTFNDQSSAAQTWQWDFGDNIGTSSLPSPTYTYAAYGAYQVKLKVTDQGCVDSTTLAIVLEPTGIANVEFSNLIKVGPNPVHNELVITTNEVISEPLNVDIHDVNGRLMRSFRINDAVSTHDLSELDAGAYYLKFSSDRGVALKKLVKLD